MCGIYLTNIERENDELRNDLKKIVFRGPDNLTINKYDLVTMPIDKSVFKTKSESLKLK